MNLPNKLTLLRVAMIPFFVLFLLLPQIPHHYLIAGLIFGAASYTDHLDGKLARKNGQITTFGKFMDPLADKILVISALICLVSLDLAPVWMVLLIVAREFMVTFIRLVAAEGGMVLAANNWGKAKTVSQIVALVVVFLFEYIRELSSMGYFVLPAEIGAFFSGVEWGLLFVAMALAVISGGVYLFQNLHILKHTK